MKSYICFPGGKFKVLTMSYDDGKLEDRRRGGAGDGRPERLRFDVWEYQHIRLPVNR